MWIHSFLCFSPHVGGQEDLCARCVWPLVEIEPLASFQCANTFAGVEALCVQVLRKSPKSSQERDLTQCEPKMKSCGPSKKRALMSLSKQDSCLNQPQLLSFCGQQILNLPVRRWTRTSECFAKFTAPVSPIFIFLLGTSSFSTGCFLSGCFWRWFVLGGLFCCFLLGRNLACNSVHSTKMTCATCAHSASNSCKKK